VQETPVDLPKPLGNFLAQPPEPLVNGDDAFADELNPGHEILGEHVEMAAAFGRAGIHVLPGFRRARIHVLPSLGCAGIDIAAQILGTGADLLSQLLPERVEPPVPIPEALIDLLEALIHLLEAPIHLLEAPIDLLEALIDLLEALIDYAEPAVEIRGEFRIHLIYCCRIARSRQEYPARDGTRSPAAVYWTRRA
jgi:hypothetical protein